MAKSKSYLPVLGKDGKLILAPRDLARFWEGVIGRPQGCWEWTKRKMPAGYGLFYLYDRDLLAHRLSYQMFHGKLKKKECACHHCDNPSCVNPAHLWKGSNLDNMQDCVKKKRHCFEEHHPGAKLTREAIREIRRLYREGFRPQWLLGERFGVTQPTISTIVHRKKWSHVK